MMDFLKLLLGFLRDCFRSREQLEAENLALRRQLDLLRRNTPKKPQSPHPKKSTSQNSRRPRLGS
jgi:hypothetical protein